MHARTVRVWFTVTISPSCHKRLLPGPVLLIGVVPINGIVDVPAGGLVEGELGGSDPILEPVAGSKTGAGTRGWGMAADPAIAGRRANAQSMAMPSMRSLEGDSLERIMAWRQPAFVCNSPDPFSLTGKIPLKFPAQKNRQK